MGPDPRGRMPGHPRRFRDQRQQGSQPRFERAPGGAQEENASQLQGREIGALYVFTRDGKVQFRCDGQYLLHQSRMLCVVGRDGTIIYPSGLHAGSHFCGDTIINHLLSWILPEVRVTDPDFAPQLQPSIDRQQPRHLDVLANLHELAQDIMQRMPPFAEIQNRGLRQQARTLAGQAQTVIGHIKAIWDAR